jgi:hypothetical protein
LVAIAVGIFAAAAAGVVVVGEGGEKGLRTEGARLEETGLDAK